jgi:hypothetical protein
MTTPAGRAVARIQQLRCLGLRGESVMPALLKELLDAILSYSNAFFGWMRTCNSGISMTRIQSPADRTHLHQRIL